MKFLIDVADLTEVRSLAGSGRVDGVTADADRG